MEVKQDEILKISSRQELRQWFVSNGLLEKYCWVVVSMREKANTLLYLDVVEEALCFGWIDSTRKKLPDGTLIQRLSRRLSLKQKSRGRPIKKSMANKPSTNQRIAITENYKNRHGDSGY